MDEMNLLNKFDENKFPSLKKEIIYNTTKDKFYLYEKDKNKFFPANSFGKRIFKNTNNNLGKLTYEERLKKNLIEKLESKLDINLYHPKMKYFDGFAQIPRPLEQPMINFKDESKKEKQILEHKSQILNYIKNRSGLIMNSKYKEILSRNINNKYAPPKDLNYYSNSIADTMNNKYKKEQTRRMIKFINKSLNNEDLSRNDKYSLNKFKNNLIINSHKDEINGVKLIKPSKIFLKKYRVFSNIMFLNPLKKSNSEHDLKINSKTYRNLYNSINNNKLTKLINKENSPIKNRNKRTDSQRYLIRPHSVINIKEEYSIFKPKKKEFTKDESKRYDTDEENKDKSNVHTKEKIDMDYTKEKKYIKGYKRQIKKQKLIIKRGNPNFISMKEIYKKELDLVKLVNPDVLKREKYENDQRDKFLIRKIEKDRKKIIIIKEKNNKIKSSRVNSAATYFIRDSEN